MSTGGGAHRWGVVSEDLKGMGAACGVEEGTVEGSGATGGRGELTRRWAPFFCEKRHPTNGPSIQCAYPENNPPRKSAQARPTPRAGANVPARSKRSDGVGNPRWRSLPCFCRKQRSGKTVVVPRGCTQYLVAASVPRVPDARKECDGEEKCTSAARRAPYPTLAFTRPRKSSTLNFLSMVSLLVQSVGSCLARAVWGTLGDCLKHCEALSWSLGLWEGQFVPEPRQRLMHCVLHKLTLSTCLRLHSPCKHTQS